MFNCSHDILIERITESMLSEIWPSVLLFPKVSEAIVHAKNDTVNNSSLQKIVLFFPSSLNFMT